MTKIAAVMAAKNEWPLLAASVSHALLNYADHIYLFDHSSTDNSKAGIAELIKVFPGRISFFESDHHPFDQESVFNILFSRACQDGYDWVHLLDADEFLIIEPGKNLATILDTVDSQWSGLALRVENYIIHSDNELGLIEELEAANFRAHSNTELGEPIETFLESVQQGRRIPQEKLTSSKMLVRTNPNIFVSHGGHQLKYGDGIDWVQFDSRVAGADPLNLFVAHLPYTSMDRLRIRNTRKFLDSGVDVRFRIVENLSAESELLNFWRTTRLAPGEEEPALSQGRIFQDETLVYALAKTCDLLRANKQLSGQVPPGELGPDFAGEAFTFGEVIAQVRRYINGADQYWPGMKK